MKWIIAAVLTGLLAAVADAGGAPASQVTVIASMHAFHEKSLSYSYQSLYASVRRLHPDFVGVEIRPEDMARDAAYLENNYPTEMIALLREWRSQAFGFDWFGNEIANAPIPDDWWEARSPIKRLEREMDGDEKFHSRRLDEIRAKELRILETATPATFNDGRYDRLNDAYYTTFADLVRGSRYEALSNFYAERDRYLAQNIVAAINRHRGACFVVVTGADHRGPLLRALKAQLGNAVRIVPLR